MSCQGFDVMESLKTIETPTLVLCGTDDFLTPPKFSEFIHREIKNSRLVMIQDAGHLLMLEKPDEVNKAIEAFVAEIAVRP